MLRRPRLAVLYVVALVLAGGFLLYPMLDLEASLSEPAAQAPALPPDNGADLLPWPEHTWDLIARVGKGETLSDILDRVDLGAYVPALTQADRKLRAFRKLKPGDPIYLNHDAEQGLTQLMVAKDSLTELHFVRTAGSNKFTAEARALDAEYRERWYENTIHTSLYVDALKAGMDGNTIMGLAKIFGWDIDFALNIRSGDTFRILVEEQYVRGKPTGDETIVAAEFVNRSKLHRAFYFTDAKGRAGYYNAKGVPMRKEFLRTPVDFTRISSHFSHSRLHPIHKIRRPHRGVDYAAPTGTPIYAAGDGTVLHKARKGGYGKTVILRHNNNITTLYAHMSNYRRGLRVGSRVKQGDTIGYVGSTGVSTGPHLHYEFRVDGVHRNPLKVKSRSAPPLPQAERRKYLRLIEPHVVALDQARKRTAQTDESGAAATKKS